MASIRARVIKGSVREGIMARAERVGLEGGLGAEVAEVHAHDVSV